MPRPPHSCACGRTVPHGQRCTCQRSATRERNRRHDSNRPSAARRGYDADWRRARIEFLNYHPLCARCGARATVVHHKIPHRGDRAIFWDRSRWQALCQPCHDRHAQREERANYVR